MTIPETYSFSNIKKLDISLEDLYANKKQINIHLSESPYIYTVLLLGLDKRPDCKISSFGANLFIRTNKGTNYQKYERIQDLQTAIKKAINNKVLNVGEIRFSLSDEISFI